MQTAWWWFGELPALLVVVALFALPVVPELALGQPGGLAVFGALFAATILYCIARLHGGWAVFSAAGLPGGTTTMLHDVTGMPIRFGLLLVPVALYVAWATDHKPPPDRGSNRGHQPARGAST